jgi:hypothetical protein
MGNEVRDVIFCQRYDEQVLTLSTLYTSSAVSLHIETRELQCPRHDARLRTGNLAKTCFHLLGRLICDWIAHLPIRGITTLIHTIHGCWLAQQYIAAGQRASALTECN